MGIVYRARQRSLNRIVAIKMLLYGRFTNPRLVERFRAEARASASLRHPHIVAIHEVGEHDGQPYFSMDYVPGKNLADLVRDHEKLTDPQNCTDRRLTDVHGQDIREVLA